MSDEELQNEINELKNQLAERDAEIERLNKRIEELESSSSTSVSRILLEEIFFFELRQCSLIRVNIMFIILR